MAGRLISKLIEPFLPSSKTQEDSEIFRWNQLENICDQMSAVNPRDRFDIQRVLQHKVFVENVLIEVVETFLKKIRVIPDEAKAKMFRELFFKLHCLPVKTVNEFILPLVLKQELFSEPGAIYFYDHLFSPSFGLKRNNSSHDLFPHMTLVTRESYANQIVPFLRLAFTVRQYDTRIVLLLLIDKFIDTMSEIDEFALSSVIIPEIICGMEEQDGTIYYNSICALARVIPIYCNQLSHFHSQEGVNTAQDNSTSSKRHSRKDSHTNANIPIDKSAESSTNENAKHLDASPTTTDGVEYERASSDIVSISLIDLVDNILIPHVLKSCIDTALDRQMLWDIIDSFVRCWKGLIIASARQKVYNVRELLKITKNMSKCLHMVMKVLPSDDKIRLLKHHICEKFELLSESTGAAPVVIIPKVLDLAIPFLRDENKNVRHEISKCVMAMVSALMITLDRAPSIARKRESDSILSTIKKVYGRMNRTRVIFSKSGPRRGTSFDKDTERKEVSSEPKDVRILPVENYYKESPIAEEQYSTYASENTALEQHESKYSDIDAIESKDADENARPHLGGPIDSSRSKYIRREVITQNREAKLAEAIERRSLQRRQVSQAVSTSSDISPSRMAKVPVVVFDGKYTDERASVKLGDAPPLNRSPQRDSRNASTKTATQQQVESSENRRYALSRSDFRGSSDIADVSVGWGDYFDEDLDLEDLKL